MSVQHIEKKHYTTYNEIEAWVSSQQGLNEAIINDIHALQKQFNSTVLVTLYHLAVKANPELKLAENSLEEPKSIK